jgi:hypothetical protein
MELHRVTDTAARQAIDSTKTFKEYMRVRHELDALGGSMFWKPVDTYEYLVQRSARKLHYLGRRSPETEKKYEEHQARKKRLQERAKSLQVMVETYQRMNKAVHAGSVPTAIINVLRKLEDLGVGEHSLLLGAPAVYAYLQPSGVRVDAIKNSAQHSRLAEADAENFSLLVEEPSTLSAWKTTISRIQTALKDVDVEEMESAPRAKTHVLKFSFRPDGKMPKMKSRDKSPLVQVQRSTSIKRVAAWVDAIKDTPKYEHVVIGKSGKMALLRTVDPQVFSVMYKRAQQAPEDMCDLPPISRYQADLVDTLLEEFLVKSKLDEPMRERLAQRLVRLDPQVGSISLPLQE